MKMLELAARVAMGGSQERNFRLGCVAKRSDGAVVFSTNERTRAPNPNAHAEARVLKKTDFGSTLWVARVNKDGSWSMARPCSKCQARIRNRGVKKVYYTISPGEYGVWYPQEGKIDKPCKKIISNYEFGSTAVWSE